MATPMGHSWCDGLKITQLTVIRGQPAHHFQCGNGILFLNGNIMTVCCLYYMLPCYISNIQHIIMLLLQRRGSDGSEADSGIARPEEDAPNKPSSCPSCYNRGSGFRRDPLTLRGPP